MREILFKAKSLNKNFYGKYSWIEGFYIRHETRQVCPIGDGLEENEIVHVIAQDSFADWNLPKKLELVEVKKETVCEYSGRRDKNGVRIFESDIILEGGEKGIVEYDSENTRFIVNFDGIILRLGFLNDSLEVIGNIYDEVK
jgi:hypothetical protein